MAFDGARSFTAKIIVAGVLGLAASGFVAGNAAQAQTVGDVGRPLVNGPDRRNDEGAQRLAYDRGRLDLVAQRDERARRQDDSRRAGANNRRRAEQSARRRQDYNRHGRDDGHRSGGGSGLGGAIQRLTR